LSGAVFADIEAVFGWVAFGVGFFAHRADDFGVLDAYDEGGLDGCFVVEGDFEFDF
jgi:hypothetical protein